MEHCLEGCASCRASHLGWHSLPILYIEGPAGALGMVGLFISGLVLFLYFRATPSKRAQLVVISCFLGAFYIFSLRFFIGLIFWYYGERTDEHYLSEAALIFVAAVLLCLAQPLWSLGRFFNYSWLKRSVIFLAVPLLGFLTIMLLVRQHYSCWFLYG